MYWCLAYICEGISDLRIYVVVTSRTRRIGGVTTIFLFNLLFCSPMIRLCSSFYSWNREGFEGFLEISVGVSFLSLQYFNFHLLFLISFSIVTWMYPNPLGCVDLILIWIFGLSIRYWRYGFWDLNLAFDQSFLIFWKLRLAAVLQFGFEIWSSYLPFVLGFAGA